jgi:hypothetical protein
LLGRPSPKKQTRPIPQIIEQLDALGQEYDEAFQQQRRIPDCTDYKAIPSANFQNLGRVLLSFSAQGRYEGVGGLLLAMGQDYSSAVQAEVRVRA